MFFLTALLLLLVLPSPWNVIGAVVSGALGLGEVTYWQRYMRRRKVQTGVENLVGATGEVSEPLAPVGQIRVLGEPVGGSRDVGAPSWDACARGCRERPQAGGRACRLSDERDQAFLALDEGLPVAETGCASESLSVGLARAVEIG